MTRLSLTFDNGPDPTTTPVVLEALDRHRMRATFFVVGDQVRRREGRALAEAARSAGHRIANHSMTHSVPLGHLEDRAKEIAEITEAEALLEGLVEGAPMFRPFGGGGHLGPHLLSSAAVDTLRDGAYTVVLWTCVPRDWEDPHGWADRALAQIRAEAWTVLVLHDLPTGAMDALPEFLDRVADAGIEVTSEFPDAAVPMRGGVDQWRFAHLVNH